MDHSLLFQLYLSGVIGPTTDFLLPKVSSVLRSANIPLVSPVSANRTKKAPKNEDSPASETVLRTLPSHTYQAQVSMYHVSIVAALC